LIQKNGEEEEEVQRQPEEEEEKLQRQPDKEEEELRKQPEEEEEKIQAKGEAIDERPPPDFVENRVQASGGGQVLSENARSFFESRFGHDFKNVRVHADSGSAEMAKSIQAQAFTHGRDIYFGAGKYNPEGSAGKQLLAHELTHVIQQTEKE
jgi:N12 class adenine-specific DNA methylase